VLFFVFSSLEFLSPIPTPHSQTFAISSFLPKTIGIVRLPYLIPYDAASQAHISMGDIDLLHPPRELEQQRHKLKRLVQSPNSFFMDVKCPGCFSM